MDTEQHEDDDVIATLASLERIQWGNFRRIPSFCQYQKTNYKTIERGGTFDYGKGLSCYGKAAHWKKRRQRIIEYRYRTFFVDSNQKAVARKMARSWPSDTR